MGLSENPTPPPENQASGLPKRRQPRKRCCLLKGCPRKYDPKRPQQRYCSSQCSQQARQWRQRKARRRYRQTAAGKQQRNVQSQRYRERTRNRKLTEKEAVDSLARVITEDSFRRLLRPPRLLRGIPAPAEKSFTAFLLPRLPARSGARRAA